jgi:zinc protease
MTRRRVPLAPLALLLGVLRVLGVLGLLGAWGAATPALAQEELANVVLQPRAGTDLVTIRVMFIAGSVADPKGKEGLTALTARLMAEGGTQTLSAAELREALFPMAAELRVQSDKELTVFAGRVHRDHLQKYMRIFADVLVRPRFDPKEFERLRRDALQDIEQRLRSSDDEALGKAALEALMYEGHPYGHYVGGTVAALQGMTLDDVKAHARRVFAQDRMVIGLGGSVDQSLGRLIKIRLGGLPKTGTKPGDVPPPKPGRARVIIVEKPTMSTAISLGYPYELRRGQRDFYPFVVGISAFGEHRQMGGRLFDALRDRRGLNYGDYAYPEAFVEVPGTTFPAPNVPRRLQQFTIWLRPVEPKNAVFALRAALHETDKLLKGGLTEDELERQKGFLDGYTRLWEAADSRRVGYTLDEIFYRQPNHVGGLRNSMPRIARDYVNGVVRKYVRPKDFRYAFVTADAAGLRAALLSGKPSPITYPTPKPPVVLAEDKTIEAFPLGFTAADIKVVKADELFAR